MGNLSEEALTSHSIHELKTSGNYPAIALSNNCNCYINKYTNHSHSYHLVFYYHALQAQEDHEGTGCESCSSHMQDFVRLKDHFRQVWGKFEQ